MAELINWIVQNAVAISGVVAALSLAAFGLATREALRVATRSQPASAAPSLLAEEGAFGSIVRSATNDLRQAAELAGSIVSDSNSKEVGSLLLARESDQNDDSSQEALEKLRDAVARIHLAEETLRVETKAKVAQIDVEILEPVVRMGERIAFHSTIPVGKHPLQMSGKLRRRMHKSKTAFFKQKTIKIDVVADEIDYEVRQPKRYKSRLQA